MLENATTSTPMNREFSMPDEMVYNRAGPVHWIILNLRAALRIEPQPYSKQATQKEVNLLNSMVPGFALMFGFFMVSHLGETVVKERSTGTLRRLIVPPVQRGALLVGKALPFFGLALFQLAFVLALCNLIFDVPMGVMAQWVWDFED